MIALVRRVSAWSPLVGQPSLSAVPTLRPSTTP
jgi:hypothetical protein